MKRTSMNQMQIAAIVAAAMPPALKAAQDRMAEIAAESDALSARLSRITDRLAGSVFPMRTDVREALEVERKELCRQFPALLAEQTRLQREIDAWRPIFNQNLRERLAPALTSVAVRISRAIADLEGALDEAEALSAPINAAGGALPAIVRPVYLNAADEAAGLLAAACQAQSTADAA
jgi:hypothetical protein